MEKQQLLQDIERIEKELGILQQKHDKLDGKVHVSSMLNIVEDKQDFGVIEQELKTKKMILKEYKERLLRMTE